MVLPCDRESGSGKSCASTISGSKAYEGDEKRRKKNHISFPSATEFADQFGNPNVDPLRQRVRDDLSAGETLTGYRKHDVLLAVLRVGHRRSRLLRRHIDFTGDVFSGRFVVSAK